MLIFLGVKMATFSTTQTGLIDQTPTSLGTDENKVTPKNTPSDKSPVTKYLDADLCQEIFGYASVVGVMLYLEGYIRFYISMPFHAVARFNFCPKRIHDISL